MTTDKLKLIQFDASTNEYESKKTTQHSFFQQKHKRKVSLSTLIRRNSGIEHIQAEAIREKRNLTKNEKLIMAINKSAQRHKQLKQNLNRATDMECYLGYKDKSPGSKRRSTHKSQHHLSQGKQNVLSDLLSSNQGSISKFFGQNRRNKKLNQSVDERISRNRVKGVQRSRESMSALLSLANNPQDKDVAFFINRVSKKAFANHQAAVGSFMKNAKNVSKEKLRAAYELHQIINRVDQDRQNLINEKLSYL